MGVAAHCGCACHKSEVLWGSDQTQSFLWQVSHEDKELPFVLTCCLRVRSGTLKFPNTSSMPKTSQQLFLLALCTVVFSFSVLNLPNAQYCSPTLKVFFTPEVGATSVEKNVV